MVCFVELVLSADVPLLALPVPLLGPVLRVDVLQGCC